jgi:hypothetical protein
MRQYLKEMSVDKVLEFSSSSDFNKHFFSELKQQSQGGGADTNPLGMFDVPTQEFLKGATYCTDAPFADEGTEVTIHKSTFEIEKISTGKLFTKSVTDWSAKKLTLDKSITKEFQPAFEKATLALMKKADSATFQIGVKNDKGNLWIVTITGGLKDDKLVLKFKDETDKFSGLAARLKESEDEAKKKEPVDLILFRYTCLLGQDPKEWATQTSALLQKAQYWPKENRPRIIAMRYDEDQKEKAEFNHPFIDDLLCLPMDRMIFLQKVEIALAFPKKITPSYLFVQPANQPIEFAKKVEIEAINEFGFAINNPVPLAMGTPGHFYVRLPNQKTTLSIYGKVIHNVRHPEKEGQYLVYFGYFGLTRENHKEIRTYMMRDPAFKVLVDTDAKHFEFNQDNIFLKDDEKVRKTVAIIDYEELTTKSYSTNLRKELGNVTVVTDDTYTGFLRKYMGTEDSNAPKAANANQTDFFQPQVSFVVTYADLNLQMPLSLPNPGDTLLGHDATTLFATPQKWFELFSDVEQKNLLMECLQIVKNTNRVTKMFELSTAAGAKKSVSIEIVLESGGMAFKLTLTAPDGLAAKSNELIRITSLDAVIINVDYLPEEPQAFVIGLAEAAKKAKLKTPPGGPKVIVICNDKQTFNFSKLFYSGVFGLIYKPMEVRRVVQNLSAAIQNPFTVYTFPNLSWRHDHIPAKLGRPATMVEISEFGASFECKTVLKKGSMFYLFESIFVNAPEANLCCRVIHSEESKDGGGMMRHTVVYFGITDAFLKFTRSYIREIYALQKAKESMTG